MNKKKQPLIGVTCGVSQTGAEGLYQHASVPMAYFQALSLAGAFGVAIPPTSETSILNKLDGLIFTGGTDVDASYYGQARQAYSNDPEKDRDRFEYQLMSDALYLDIPILGICRGAQLLNIVFGGELFQDILKEANFANMHNVKSEKEFSHKIKFIGNSKLSILTNNAVVNVNSVHHQAIKKLGKDLKIVAKANDNLIEAIESIKHRWVVGVQWHPETIAILDEFHQHIFDSFVGEINKNLNNKFLIN